MSHSRLLPSPPSHLSGSPRTAQPGGGHGSSLLLRAPRGKARTPLPSSAVPNRLTRTTAESRIPFPGVALARLAGARAAGDRAAQSRAGGSSARRICDGRRSAHGRDRGSISAAIVSSSLPTRTQFHLSMIACCFRNKGWRHEVPWSIPHRAVCTAQVPDARNPRHDRRRRRLAAPTLASTAFTDTAHGRDREWVEQSCPWLRASAWRPESINLLCLNLPFSSESIYGCCQGYQCWKNSKQNCCTVVHHPPLLCRSRFGGGGSASGPRNGSRRCSGCTFRCLLCVFSGFLCQRLCVQGSLFGHGLCVLRCLDHPTP